MTSKENYNVESFLNFAEKRVKGEKGNQESIYSAIQPTTYKKMSRPLCKKPHALHRCKEFREKGAKDRRQFVSSRSCICFNCLSTRHKVAECPDERRCSHCEGKHHTLIHQLKSTEAKVNIVNEEIASEDEFDNESKIAVNMSIGFKKVLLLTVSVMGSNQKLLTALEDTGAQVLIISPEALNKLWKKVKVKNYINLTKIRGVVNNRSILIKRYVKLQLTNCDKTASIQKGCYMMEMNQEIEAATIQDIETKGLCIREIGDINIL
jgi:hypothetical protein